MRDLTAISLNTAKRHGASYADIRVVETTVEELTVRNGELGEIQQGNSIGCGIRVLVDGAWGFAASPNLTKKAIRDHTVQACAVAKAGARLRRGKVRCLMKGWWTALTGLRPSVPRRSTRARSGEAVS